MIKTIKAKFTDGVLMPLEPLESLNLAEGDEVLVTLQPKPALSYEELTKTSMSTAGGWAGIDGEELKRLIYTSRHRGFDCDCMYCAPEG